MSAQYQTAAERAHRDGGGNGGNGVSEIPGVRPRSQVLESEVLRMVEIFEHNERVATRLMAEHAENDGSASDWWLAKAEAWEQAAGLLRGIAG